MQGGGGGGATVVNGRGRENGVEVRRGGGHFSPDTDSLSPGLGENRCAATPQDREIRLRHNERRRLPLRSGLRGNFPDRKTGVGPISANFGPTSAKFGGSSTGLGRRRPAFREVAWPLFRNARVMVGLGGGELAEYRQASGSGRLRSCASTPPGARAAWSSAISFSKSGSISSRTDLHRQILSASSAIAGPTAPCPGSWDARARVRALRASSSGR